MIKKPKITTILLTYKRPFLLNKAINSVLTQTYDKIKLSIFDNASGDKTSQIVKKHNKIDDRINYHCHKKNIGFKRNLRHGLETVDTEYFSILCDDDLHASEFYKDAIEVLENNLDIDFIILDCLNFDSTNIINNPLFDGKLRFYKGFSRFDTIHNGEISLTLTGIVFRKKLADVFLNTHDNFDLGSDIRFTFLAAAKYNYAYLSKVGAYIYHHENEISANRQYFNPIDDVIRMERYAEIMYDDDVPEEIKEKARLYFEKKLNTNIKFMYFKIFIRSYVNCYISYNDKNFNIIIQYFTYLKKRNKRITAFILSFVFANKLIKGLLFPILFLLNIYKNKRNQRRLIFFDSIKKTKFKNNFEDIISKSQFK